MSTTAGYLRTAPRWRLRLHWPRLHLPRRRRRTSHVAITPLVDIYPPG